MRAERDHQEDKLYEATFYCSLLLSAPSQREAIKRVMEVARKNHLKIEEGFSDGLHVYRHRPNGMLSKINRKPKSE